MKTLLIRDTNYSFLKVLTNSENKTMTIKLEKGSVDYSNACKWFHKNNMSLEIGNELTY